LDATLIQTRSESYGAILTNNPKIAEIAKSFGKNSLLFDRQDPEGFINFVQDKLRDTLTNNGPVIIITNIKFDEAQQRKLSDAITKAVQESFLSLDKMIEQAAAKGDQALVDILTQRKTDITTV
jgi:hypothetical protein